MWYRVKDIWFGFWGRDEEAGGSALLDVTAC